MEKNIKYFLGPMSKNVVDAVLDYNNKFGITFGFIPSRRQVEYSGGYVNNWTTEVFSKYVKTKSQNTIIERDHGGPGQGYNEDDGLESFKHDSNHFDIIHIDPWKKYPSLEDGISKTIENIVYCSSISNSVHFEVGTEEAIRKFDVDEIEILLSALEKELNPELFERIVYVVVQSGVGLNLGKMKNTGVYNPDRLTDMVDIVKKFKKLSKEHNGDYLKFLDIEKRFSNGLDAINIAPELGQLETKIYIQMFKKYDQIFNNFFEICKDSKRWVKWVSNDYNPDLNKEELIQICGHYCFSDEDFTRVVSKYLEIEKISFNELNEKVKNEIKLHLKQITEDENGIH